MKSLKLKKLFIFCSLAFLSFTCFGQEDAAITITSNGKQYQTIIVEENVGNSIESSADFKPEGNSLYSGQQMKELGGDRVGVLTGTFFVKTKQNKVLSVPNAEVMEIGDGYYLVLAPQGLELLALIEQLKVLDNVEHVELEVSFKDSMPY